MSVDRTEDSANRNPSQGLNIESKRPRIVVVGSINMDVVVRVPRIVAPGETLSATQLSEIPGGKGANQAVAAARLGADVTMIGRVGSDGYGQQLLTSLQQSGVNVSSIEKSIGPSGLAIIQVDDSGENSIVILAGANGQLSPDDVQRCEAEIASADVMLLQLEIPIATIRHAIAIAAKHGVAVQLDPAPALTNLDLPWHQLDTLCPNETELSILASQCHPSDSSERSEPAHHRVDAPETQTTLSRAQLLLQSGARQILVTQGACGSLLVENGQALSWPAYRVASVDSTAAGDAFRAAYAVARASGQTGIDAIRFASAAGALATTRHGAQPSLPSRAEVEQLIAASDANP